MQVGRNRIVYQVCVSILVLYSHRKITTGKAYEVDRLAGFIEQAVERQVLLSAIESIEHVLGLPIYHLAPNVGRRTLWSARFLAQDTTAEGPLYEAIRPARICAR